MSPPVVSSSIQQKFLKLFQEISVFFSGERQLLDKDKSQLVLARTCALELAKESASPQFDRFLTYLLGSTEITADYPLQAVRMLSLMTKALHGEKISADQRQELLTAALLADTGFRPAWLGHHGSHFEVTAYQLKGLSLPWFTPGLERLIMNHHSPADDASPFKILSLLGRYLGMVYGTGIEDIGQPLISPAKTMEILMTELHPEAPGLRMLLKAISAFPIGSWVQLNSGQVALVLGASPKNPLRPKVGLYRTPAKNGSTWEEIELEKKPTAHISGEMSPSPAQVSVLNFPEIIVPGWLVLTESPEGPRQPPAADIVNSIEAPGPESGVLPANLRNAEDYRRFVLQKNKPSSVDPGPSLEPSPGAGALPAAGAWKSDDFSPESLGGGKGRLMKFYREELMKLRTTWEQQVRAAEQVSSSLKSPLIESYRRENELMSAMIERLEAIGADVVEPAAKAQTQAEPESEPAAEKELPAPEPPDAVAFPKPRAPAAQETAEFSVQLSENPETGLNQIQEHIGTFQGQVEKDQEVLVDLKRRFAETLAHLESREFKTLPSLIVFVRQWQEKLQPMQNELEEAGQETASLSAEWNTLYAAAKALAAGPAAGRDLSWKEQIKPRMEKLLSQAGQFLALHHQRLIAHDRMIERFCTEARQLAV